MDAAQLSNQQLYAIIQNEKLDAAIRKVANDEFNSRQLSPTEVEHIISAHDRSFVAEKQVPLQWAFKLLLIACPFFLELQSILAGRLLAKGQKRQFKEYWQFLMIGLVLWTVGIIIAARMYFSSN